MQHSNEAEETLTKLWKASATYKDDYQPDVEQGLLALKKRITNEKATVIPINRSRRIYSIAATLLLLIASASVLYLHLNKSPERQLVSTQATILKDMALSDGSIISLNRHSQLDYPSYFAEESRTVLLEGEAFFQIEKNEYKPFIVQTPHGKIQVLGTSFNVRAYPDESIVIVEVTEGQVLYSVNKQEIVLNAGNKVIFNKEKNTLSGLQNIGWEDLAWRESKLNFTDEPMSNILDYLKENFDISVHYTNIDLADCPLTATLVDNDPDAILKETKSAFPSLKLLKTDKHTYQLSGHCD